MTEKTSRLKAHVLDPDAKDETVRPQDDFYRHINGGWLDTHVIPDDRASDGAFYKLVEDSEELRRKIAEDAVSGRLTGEEAERIGILYEQFMDVATLNKLGATPIQPLLGMIEEAQTREELASVSGTLERLGVPSFFSVDVFADLNDTTKYVVNFDQAGLGLPDESYYTGDEYEDYRSKYVSHVQNVLAMAGVTSKEEASLAAAEVMDFETLLATHHWDVVATRDVESQNNPRSWAALVESSPGFSWDVWMSSFGVDLADQNLNVGQPDYLTAASDLWKHTHLHTLKYWMARRVIDAFAPYLSEEFAEETFDFYGRTLAGIQKMRPRWRRALALIESVVGFDMGRLYTQRHFPAEYKERMKVLVGNLLDAYENSIKDLEWMGEDTKKRALEKLGTFQTKIGYPDNPRSYKGLEISKDKTLIENLEASSEFDIEWEFSKLGGPVDRTEWLMTPQTVNAYYYPSMNEIVFPAAILQPPFFNPDADDAVNYAGIGAVIGHEIGHGFDDQGSQFDAAGEVRDWWTDEDREEFQKRTKALIDQYDRYSPAALDDEHKVNGALTVGENIGDLGGLTIAWKAWMKALADQGIDSAEDAEVIDGLTAPERFFTSWARIWQGKNRDDYAVQLLAIDPHSPNEFRCNGVLANFDEFADYYNIQPEDDLWIAPEERVRIW